MYLINFVIQFFNFLSTRVLPKSGDVDKDDHFDVGDVNSDEFHVFERHRQKLAVSDDDM